MPLAIARAAHAFAINGDYALNVSSHTAKPLMAGLLQRLGVDQAKHPSKSVVRGYAVGQLQKTRKPLPLGLTKLDNLSPVVSPSYDGTQSDDQYVQQLVALGASHAGVRHPAQVLYQAAALGLGHARLTAGGFDAP